MPADDELPEGTDSIIEGAGEDGDEQAIADEIEMSLGDEDLPGSRAGGAGGASAGTGDLRGMFFGQVDDLTGQAGDRARELAQAGKDRAIAAMEDVIRLMEQAADEIDSRLGADYGDYARRAAEGIGSFSDAFKAKDVDALFADVREIVRKSPGVTIGAAAAVGFAVARIVRAGLPEATPGAAGAAGRDAAKD